MVQHLALKRVGGRHTRGRGGGWEAAAAVRAETMRARWREPRPRTVARSKRERQSALLEESTAAGGGTPSARYAVACARPPR